MPRIRTLKPELPQSECLARVPREARYLFVLLKTLADDEGRLRGSPDMLARTLFPYDDDVMDKIGGWLEALERDAQAIVRYTVGRAKLIQIRDFLESKSHLPERPEWAERPDHPSRSKLPPPPDALASSAPSGDIGSREVSRAFASVREDSRGLASDLDLDQDQDQTGTTDLRPTESESSTPSLARSVSDWADQLLRVYPPRDRPFAKRPVVNALKRAMLRHHDFDPAAVVAAVERFAAAERKAGRVGTRFVPEPESFLDDDRWEAYPAPAAVALAGPPIAGPAEDVPDDPRWAAVKQRLAERLGADVMASWFGRAVSLVSIENGVVTLAAATKFLHSWIGQHYADALLDGWRAEAPGITRVELVIGSRQWVERTRQAQAARESRSEVIPPVGSSPLDPAAIRSAVQQLTRETVMLEGSEQVARYLGAHEKLPAIDKLTEWLTALGNDASTLVQILAQAKRRELAGKAALGWIEQQVRAHAPANMLRLGPAQAKPQGEGAAEPIGRRRGPIRSRRRKSA